MSWIRTIFSFREQHEGDVEKPFLDHLEDLRQTLFKIGSVVAAGMILAFCFNQQLLELLQKPLHDVEPTTNLNITSITEPFNIAISLSFYAGIVLTFPILLFFVAEFVLPALTRREKRLLLPGISVGFVLFGSGVWISYHSILPKTLHWFHDFATNRHFNTLWTAKSYFSFVTHLSIACGLLCELPLVMISLSALGVISFEFLQKTRRYGVAVILVLVAIISPTPDPITFITLAIPMLAIFEGSIWLVWLIERNKRKTALAEENKRD